MYVYQLIDGGGGEIMLIRGVDQIKADNWLAKIPTIFVQYCALYKLYSLMPKARGQAQHGGPTGWLESRVTQHWVLLYVMDGPCSLP